jgi:hypothetical protein
MLSLRWIQNIYNITISGEGSGGAAGARAPLPLPPPLEPPSSPPRLEVEEEEGNGGLEEEEGRSSRSGKLVSPLITITLSTLWMKQEMKTLQVNKHLGKLIVKRNPQQKYNCSKLHARIQDSQVESIHKTNAKQTDAW